MVIGVCLTLFSHRILRWWQKVGGSFALKITPIRKSPDKTIDDLIYEWDKSKWKAWDIIGIWCLRIMGVLFTFGGALVFIALISQL
jgi:hypothetical protein